MHPLPICGRGDAEFSFSFFKPVLLSFPASVVRTAKRHKSSRRCQTAGMRGWASPHPWRSQLKNKDNSWILRSLVQVIPEFSCVFWIQSPHISCLLQENGVMWSFCTFKSMIIKAFSFFFYFVTMCVPVESCPHWNYPEIKQQPHRETFKEVPLVLNIISVPGH